MLSHRFSKKRYIFLLFFLLIACLGIVIGILHNHTSDDPQICNAKMNDDLALMSRYIEISRAFKRVCEATRVSWPR